MEPFFISPQAIVAPAHTHEPRVSAPFIAPENSVSTSSAYSELERIRTHFNSMSRHVDFKKILRDKYHHSTPLTTKPPTT